MMTQPWDDAYHELWRHAAHHRGLREAIGELPGHTLSQNVRQWPRTCGGDVLAIAAVIDPMLRAAPLETGGHGIERKWQRCTHDLADAALREPMREYRHNREFWSVLASIAAYLASVDATVPEDVWQALLADVATPERAPRNSIIADQIFQVVSFSYDELWQELKRGLAQLRGADVRDPGPDVRGGRMTVPRTTNADVLQLAALWTNALALVEHKRRAMGASGVQALHWAGLDGELRRWRAVLDYVDANAATGDPAAIYPQNEAFWRATASVSTTVAVLDEAPPPFEMRLDPVGQRPSTQHRNASYPGAGSFEQRWDKQHDDFADARGFDLRDPLPGRTGRPMKIPRTLNAEIVKLANDWHAAWKKLDGRRGIFGNIPGEEIGLDTLEKRWKAVMKDVSEIAEPGKVDEVYPKNHEFWRETHELAETLDLYNEIPTRFDIAIDIAKTLPDRFADVVGDVMKAVGNVAKKAGEGVASGIGKPILIGGSVILGGFLLWRLVRRPAVAEAA
jgi:hypothetical protein